MIICAIQLNNRESKKMSKPKLKEINTFWIVQGDSNPGTNATLFVMNSELIYKNYGVIKDVTAPKKQPNEKDKKFVIIKTDKGKYQLLISKIGETSDVRVLAESPTEFRSTLICNLIYLYFQSNT